jgi:hypothetical protein
MTLPLALLGAKALYLLFAWLLSAIVASWLSGRKGYGERIGLASGLILVVLGVLIWLLVPPRAGSAWKEVGPLPRRGRARELGPAQGDRPAST